MKTIKGSLLLSSFLSFSLYATTYVVMNSEDSGTDSLRDILSYAGDNDFIEFDSSVSGTITLASSLPTITQNDLTITGNVVLGSNTIAIDGDSAYRIFDVQGNNFIVANIDLSNGVHANKGGAINVAESKIAFLQDANVAVSSNSNGINPLYITDGELNLINVTFSGTSTSQIYLNGGSVIVTSNDPMECIIDGENEANVNKYGSARTVHTTPGGTPPVYNLTANEGILEFNGTLNGACTILSNGTLEGIFTMNEVNNHGTLEPGISSSSTIGTATIDGDYNQEGTLRIKVTAAGSKDFIDATGSGALDGVLTLIPSSGTYNQNDTFTIIECDNGINGTFDTINYGGLDATIHYNTNTVVIEITNTTII